MPMNPRTRVSSEFRLTKGTHELLKRIEKITSTIQIFAKHKLPEQRRKSEIMIID